MAIIIAKNITQNDIEISDMYGTYIPANNQVTLTEQLPYPIIENSQDLKTYIQNGSIVINDGTTDLNIQNSLNHLRISTYNEIPKKLIDLEGIPTPSNNRFLSSINENEFQWITKEEINSSIGIIINLQKNRNINNATWLNNNGDKVSGSYSGWTSSYPTILPTNCAISKILIAFKGASYDWRSSPGNLFFCLSIYTHLYNSASLKTSLNLELDGDFTGSSFDHTSYIWTVNTFTELTGSNLFSEKDVVGFMFRKDNTQPGQIWRVKELIVTILFEGV